MVACFIGHRTIHIDDKLTFLLKQTIISLIERGVTTFIFGSKSDFDDLSWKVVTEFKSNYPFIKRVHVRSAHQNIDSSYEKYLLELYESTYFPPRIKNAGKYSYVERNYEMIDISTHCVFYYNENYVTPRARQSKNKVLTQTKTKSGTKVAYEYALRKNKTVINLYKSQ